MKTLLLFSFILILSTPSISNSNSNCFPQPEGTPEDIFLEGDLPESSSRKMQNTPIHATISSSFLNVIFANNLREICVEVISASGNTMYSTKVNTQTQSSLSVDVSNWSSGMYQVRFVNPKGQYLQGKFSIQ